MNEQIKTIKASEYAMSGCEFIADMVGSLGFAFHKDEEAGTWAYINDMQAELASDMDVDIAAIKAVCGEFVGGFAG